MICSQGGYKLADTWRTRAPHPSLYLVRNMPHNCRYLCGATHKNRILSPVTPEAASSSLVTPANLFNDLDDFEPPSGGSFLRWRTFGGH